MKGDKETKRKSKKERKKKRQKGPGAVWREENRSYLLDHLPEGPTSGLDNDKTTHTAPGIYISKHTEHGITFLFFFIQNCL